MHSISFNMTVSFFLYYDVSRIIIFCSFIYMTAPTHIAVSVNTINIFIGFCSEWWAHIRPGLWASGQRGERESGCEKLQDPSLGLGKSNPWGHPGNQQG